MSSSYVRTEIKAFLAANFPTEDVIDMTAQFQELKEFLADNSLTYESAWLGIDFIGTEEVPISVTSDSTTGCYREMGSVFFHIVDPARSASADNILNRSEVLRSGLRGQRIGDIIIEGVTPLSTEAGGTLDFSGGFVSGSFIANY